MKTKLPIINTLLLTAILAWLAIGQITEKEPEREKQAYVVTNELYTGFQYQIELDREYGKIKAEKEKELNFTKNSLMELERKIVEGIASDEEVEAYQTGLANFRRTEQEVQQELMSISNDYNQKIWDKLTAFTEEYGKKKNYEVIFGAGGNGNIMHASEEKNITNDLIAFCNQKYSGHAQTSVE